VTFTESHNYVQLLSFVPAVIRDDAYCANNRSISNSFEHRSHVPNLNLTVARKLSNAHFQIVDRSTDEYENDEVRNKKCTTAIVIRDEWKPISETDKPYW